MVLENLTAMARAVEDNWCAAWATLAAVRQEPRTIVDIPPEFVRVHTPGMQESLLNIVLRYSGPGPVTRDDVERVIEPYRRNRLPLQWWQLAGSEPAGLRDQLQAVGMQCWGGVPAMALPLDGWHPKLPSFPQDAELYRVTTTGEAREALAIIADVFFVPEAPMARWTSENAAFQLYYANWRGRPAATLATLRDKATGSVGVYHVATMPWARRRGLASHLLATALYEAREAGSTLATLTATPEARRMYEQLGFRAFGSIDQWMPGPRLMNDLLYGGYAPSGMMWE